MKNIVSAVFVCCLAVFIAGCSSADTYKIPTGMQVRLKSEVAKCKFLGDVHGTSGWYGMFVDAGLRNARTEAFQEVKKLGGNTVVWTSFSTPYGSTSVPGNAYLCPAGTNSNIKKGKG